MEYDFTYNQGYRYLTGIDVYDGGVIIQLIDKEDDLSYICHDVRLSADQLNSLLLVLNIPGDVSYSITQMNVILKVSKSEEDSITVDMNRMKVVLPKVDGKFFILQLQSQKDRHKKETVV